MAFSLFGKKQPEPPKPAAKKPAARPAAPEKPPAKPTEQPVRKELEPLDFTAPGALDEAGRQDQIEISDSASTAHPVVEEAAILYANGQDAMALAALEGAIDEGGLGPATDQVWAMLFDLYLLMGKRESFETRALEYSVKSEKSPPTWVEPAREPVNRGSGSGGQAFVALGATINEASEKAIKQFEKIVAASPVARVDLGKIQSADDAGCGLLLKAVKAARKAKCELVLAGAEPFAQVLARKAVPGKRENEPAWLLLLELYQHMGQQETFEEMALQYAITFEVSPPSWEKPPVAPKKKTAAVAEPPAAESFALAGEIHSGSSEPFQRLHDYAQTQEQLAIDCAALKRMDFVSAGMFLNTLTHLQTQGKPVHIRGANAMLYALFGVLGINQLAQVERRKL